MYALHLLFLSGLKYIIFFMSPLVKLYGLLARVFKLATIDYYLHLYLST